MYSEHYSTLYQDKVPVNENFIFIKLTFHM